MNNYLQRFTIVKSMLLLLLMSSFVTTISATTYPVTTNADAGPGSLRDAITQANANAGADIINFAIGSGATTITLTTVLPAITESINIDGTTQPTYAGTPLVKIVFNGTVITLSSAHNSTIRAVDLGNPLATLQGFGLAATNCNVLNLLDNRVSNKTIGFLISGGQDVTITNNNMVDVSNQANLEAIRLVGITANLLPRAVFIQGNTFSGTTGMATCLKVQNMENQVISDGSVAGTNIFMPNTMRHQAFSAFSLLLDNVDRTTVANLDLVYTGGSLSGDGLFAQNCDSLSILNNAIGTRARGIRILGGSDIRILNNTLSNVSNNANHGGIEIANVTSTTLAGGLLLQGNTFSGTLGMQTAFYLGNIPDLVISDGSVVGTNVFVPNSTGHQAFETFVVRLANTDRSTISNLDLSYTGVGLSGDGLFALNCDSLSVLNNTINLRNRGINISGGSDVRILNNNLSNVSDHQNRGAIHLSTISANTLPRGVILEGNLLSGTIGMETGLYMENMDYQIISDGSLANTNIRIQESDGFSFIKSRSLLLNNTDTIQVSDLNLSYFGNSNLGAGIYVQNIEDIDLNRIKVCNRVTGIDLNTCDADTIRNSILTNNTNGIQALNSNVAVQASNIMNNGTGIRNLTGTTTVMAVNNYWNAPDGSTTEGGSGDTYIGNVTATPFSTTKITTAPGEGTLIYTPTMITGLIATCDAGASTTFQVEGQCLVANVVIAAPTGFQVSLDNIVFSNTVTLTIAGGTFSPNPSTVYVRIGAGNSGGPISGNITLSAGDNIQMLALSGMVTAPSTDLARGDVLDFDGTNDYVRIGNTPSLNFDNTSTFTIESWAQWNAGLGMIVSKMNNVSPFPGYELYIDGSGAVNVFLINTWVTNAIFVTSNSTPFADNLMHHVAVTYDGSNSASGVHIYVDGILHTQNITYNNLTNSIQNTANANIGARTPGAFYFNGQLDETRIWNVARTADEVRENMHLTLSGCETGIVSYYQMNDGTGSTILTDKVGTNNGTLINMDAATDWVASKINIGDDAVNNSNSQTITAVPTGTSTQNFTAANLSMRFFTHSGVEDYTVTYQEFTPNTINGADGVNIIQNPMWTVNKSTSIETQLVDYTFIYPTSTFINLDPAKYALYWRSMNGEGNWTKISTAHSVTTTTVGFGKISLIGQFMVVQESNDLVSDVRGNMYTISENFERIFVPGINLSNASFTIELWAKRNSTTTEDHFFGQGVGATRRGLHARYNQNGSISFAFFLDDLVTVPQSAATDGEWHHLAFVYNAVTRQREIFIDGVSIATNTAGGNFADVAGMNIGAQFPSGVSSGNSFDGALDEFRVWNSVRTQAEIRENMHLTLKGNETALLSYYQFNNDDPVGTANGVKDAMGNNDGTTVNLTTADYIASEVAVAGGTFDRMTITAGGAYNFPNTDVDINFGATTPNGEIVIYRLETEKPHGWETLTGDVDNEYFVVENFGTNTTFSALNDITFDRLSYISPVDVGQAQATTPLQLYKREDNDFGASWGSSFGGADNASAGTNAMMSFNATNNLTSFSQIVLVNNGPNSGLPVELLSFDAERVNSSEIQLDWSTVTETNNKGFYIERMLELESEFETISFVGGNGTTVNTSFYELIDENSYTGVSYYRLKQVDFDGTETYSEIKAVAGTKNSSNSDVRIYPNPVSDILKVSVSDLPTTVKQARIQIISANGQVLYDFTKDLQAYQVIEINQIQNLPAALYLIQIELDNGDKLWKKFIKE